MVPPACCIKKTVAARRRTATVEVIGFAGVWLTLALSWVCIYTTDTPDKGYNYCAHLSAECKEIAKLTPTHSAG
jgi:hypothetical protein